MHDLIIVGGGPSGLSASINASSEGLKTLLLDGSKTLGGQIKSSAMIENLLGFQRIAGNDLIARAIDQAQNFGVEIKMNSKVKRIKKTGNIFSVFTNSETYHARCVLLALGLGPRKLKLENGEAHKRKIHYGFSEACAVQFNGLHASVLGGANSAAQCALSLNDHGAMVTILVRSKLDCSQYLLDRIGKAKIKIKTATPKAIFESGLELTNGKSLPCNGLFVFIGRQPYTGWTNDICERDAQGYIVADASNQTTCEGLFVSGDTRKGSTHRASFAIGDGAHAIQGIHKYLRGGP